MKKLESITFIFEDGELELTYAEVRDLGSDMLDTMLNSNVGISDTIEIDVEKATFIALINVMNEPIEVTTDMILLANYLQMTGIMGKLYEWHIFITKTEEKLVEVSRLRSSWTFQRVRTQRLNPNADLDVVMIANQGLVQIDVLFDDRHVLVDWIFAGLDYGVAESMSKKHFRPNRLRDLVCGDPRCTSEIFARVFTLPGQEMIMINNYVARGLLSESLADQISKLSRSELSMAELTVTQLGPLDGVLQAPSFEKSNEPFIPVYLQSRMRPGKSREEAEFEYNEEMRRFREEARHETERNVDRQLAKEREREARRRRENDDMYFDRLWDDLRSEIDTLSTEEIYERVDEYLKDTSIWWDVEYVRNLFYSHIDSF